MGHFTDTLENNLIGQYQSSDTFIGFLKALASEADNLAINIEDVFQNRYFATAVGVQLDIIGAIVGVSREVLDFADTIYFGFDPDITSKTLGDLDDPTVGGRFRSADENPVEIRLLTDDEYRILITAKILKNSSNITPNEVLQITRQILILLYPVDGDTIELNIDENGEATFEIQIGRVLPVTEQAFVQGLDLIPRPVGVSVSYNYYTP